MSERVQGVNQKATATAKAHWIVDLTSFLRMLRLIRHIRRAPAQAVTTLQQAEERRTIIEEAMTMMIILTIITAAAAA